MLIGKFVYLGLKFINNIHNLFSLKNQLLRATGKPVDRCGSVFIIIFSVEDRDDET